MIRVLIVDDVPLIRQSLSVFVEGFNDMTVVSGMVSNGEQAVEWLKESYADLCITDIRMPVMDGLQLIEQINAKFRWMACLVVSSYDDFEYAKQSIELNALDYVLKPVKKESMNKALIKATNKIHELRNRDAAQLFLKRLPHHRAQLEQWLEHIQTLRMDTFPLLIVETLDLLERWVEGNYYLLNPLSNLWLQTLVEELTSDRLQMELDEGKDLGLGDKHLELSSTRYYFRLCAVRRLEEGAYRLIASMRGVRDQQSVKVVNQIKEYIKEHCGESINLQNLADHVALNKTYMCKLFKEETEQTIHTYIVLERMQLARNLLLEGGSKVYEIAKQVGYEDADYFTQIFKKHYGLSPLDYKKRMKS
ncbi:response regulator [Paenibacillus sp. JSM ZJ436]|uniref:Two component transcriptional regulator, AraC family n=1 Tax=Paenibacillus algicola TaxID=2565926 RepID=A0A4P8XQP4_9BACL|nr:response regulator [Paenibacillus algicola]QCT04051.1 two component transcriptional regulator, AraC family [Paenibacillus algicola]